MSDWNGTYASFAAAYVRGEAIKARARGGQITPPDDETKCRPLVPAPELSDPPLAALPAEEIHALLTLGREAGLKLYHFKKSHGELPRVKCALNFLRSLAFETVLDVESRRGAFLWPLMDAFPNAKVTGTNLLPRRVDFLESVRMGGAENLRAVQADICKLDEMDGAYDVVTLLEVLEHILCVADAVKNAVRLAKKCVVVSVPSAPDDTPEHVHLLTKEALTRLFEDAGCARLRFDCVDSHHLLIAFKEI